MNDIKKLLLDAVPALPAPPDRLAAVRGRAAARRRLHVMGTAAAAVAAVLALGATMTVLSAAGPGDRTGGPATMGSPTISPSAPVAVEPPKDFPMPTPGACPPSVQLLRMPLLENYPGGTLPEFAAVTVCRYAQTTFDLSKGENTLVAGPAAGDIGRFRTAFAELAAPYSSPAVPSAPYSSSSAPPCFDDGPPYPVDVVFVHSPGGGSAAAFLLRTECGGPQSRHTSLFAAVDAVLGPPS